jgi:hypothetical protein
MAALSFDPTHAVRFDLPHGSVRTGGEDECVLLVPVSALQPLVLSSPPDVVVAFGRALGGAIGRRAARRADPHSSSLEEFVTQLAGEAAISGVGRLGVERWGRALVVVVEETTLPSALLTALVAGAVEAASGRRVATTLVSRDERAARVLVGSEGGVARVQDWVAAGVPWGEALTKLHGERV